MTCERNGSAAGKGLALLLAILVMLMSVSCSRPAPEADSLPEGEPDLRITSFDVGYDSEGEAILLQSEGCSLLMDTGSIMTGTVIEKLKQAKVTEFEIYLSHWHDDHYGQILNILYDDDFHVSRVYLPEPDAIEHLYNVEKYGHMPWWKDFQRHWNAYKEILRALEEKKIETVYLGQGSAFKVGSARGEVLYLDKEPYLDNSVSNTRSYINNSSLATMITSAGGIRYLTCGDIEKETEGKILQDGIDVSCNIFKMSHHGAKTSNTEEFLKAVSPEYAFYTIKEKKFNRKPFFLGDSVNRMIRYSTVFSGSRNGDIVFEIYGKMIVADAEKRTREETVVYKRADGREVSRTVVSNMEAPAYLDSCALPEGAEYISGGEDMTVRTGH